MNMHVRERERCAREFTMVETSTFRDRLEHTIEALIALLDAIDGDADLEPTFGDIPASGFDEGEEDDAEEDDGTSEPSLGAPEGLARGPVMHFDGYAYRTAKGVKRFHLGSQEHWTQGEGSFDAEEEFDGLEDDDGREHDDNGVADEDGMQEQFGGFHPGGYVGVL